MHSKNAGVVAHALLLLPLMYPPLTAASTRVEMSVGAESELQDNFYYQEIDKRQVSTWVLQPDVTLISKGQVIESQLNMNLRAATTSGRGADDFVDYDVNGRIQAESGYNFLIAGARTHRGHDPFGTLRTEGNSNLNRDLDVWLQNEFNLTWQRHGEIKGQMFSEVSADLITRNYITNEAATNFLDRKSVTYSGLAGYQFTSKSGVFLAAARSKVDFDNEDSGVIRSATIDSYSFGLRWTATAQTSGELRAGLQHREQDDTAVTAKQNWWQARLHWTPTKTDTVQLLTGRRLEESYLTNVPFINVTTHRMVWGHEWTDSFSSNISGALRSSKFTSIDEKDDSSFLDLGFEYMLDQGLLFFGHAQLTKRDSTRTLRSYETNGLRIGVRMTLN